MRRPLPNTYWVIDGRFLAGEYPGGVTPRDSERRIEKLLSAGIDYFIDLTELHEVPDYRSLLPPQAGYYRRPLPDHGVPEDAGQMREIQAALAAALDAGRRVYVHCRAGIGRTGMSVGCWLIEEGLVPDAALAQLNVLWRQNARSSQWPRVPETEAQIEFVRRWAVSRTARAGGGAVNGTRAVGAMPAAALRAASAAAAPGGRLDRARGAFLGLAIGDAQGGAAAEGLPPGTWTDDTAMALCQADSLLACGGVDTRDQAERYLRWLREGYRSATGVAAGVRPAARRALALAAARGSALTGTHDPRVLDKEPLVRCAPAVIFHADDLASAAEAAADAVRVTHQAPVLVDACRLFAGLLHTALNGADRPAVLAHYQRWVGVLRPEVIELAAAWSRAGAAPALRPQRRGTLLEALDLVVRTWAATPDFSQGLAAVTAPGVEDADVLGAAYGQLAGATFGESGMPPALLAGLVQAEEIAALAEALLPGGTRTGAGAVTGRAGSL